MMHLSIEGSVALLKDSMLVVLYPIQNVRPSRKSYTERFVVYQVLWIYTNVDTSSHCSYLSESIQNARFDFGTSVLRVLPNPLGWRFSVPKILPSRCPFDDVYGSMSM